MRNTKIIFVGNYKGGVGKTTSVLNFAEYFSLEDNRDKTAKNKVLVLDIDPQSSLSEILVTNGVNRELSDLNERETLNYVFDLCITKVEKYSNIELKFDTTMLIKKYKSSFDFIPSSLFYKNNEINLGLDSLVLKMKDNIQYLSILKNFVDTIKEEYDYIIIDCPPANNLITRSAFLMSDYYIIPTVLDGLSTNGVIHYINEIEETYNRYCVIGQDALLSRHFFGEQPKLVGIFYNLIRGQVNYDEAKANFEDAIDRLTPYGRDIILNNEINNYIDIARKTQDGKVSINKRDFEGLTKEIIRKI
ncbi:MAG: ParA family protein [Acetivibrio ethanolgignens]